LVRDSGLYYILNTFDEEHSKQSYDGKREH
jgi:hypothetical protein